jgi:RNA polymerase sigma factor (sigma-70 family)
MQNFPSTRYSILVDLGSEQEPLRRHALDRFVEAYWKPVYKYIRLRWRKDPSDAEDLTQTFFKDLLERGFLTRFDAEKASFRSFLRVCVDKNVLKVHESETREKRGGGAVVLSLDFPSAERELPLTTPEGSPEDIFYREWQRQIFALALEDLRRWCRESGKEAQLAVFEAYDLAAAERPSYQELADRHGTPVTNITNYLAWARRELRRLTLERLAGITAGDSEFRSEAQRLFAP